jgi:TonB family protein
MSGAFSRLLTFRVAISFACLLLVHGLASAELPSQTTGEEYKAAIAGYQLSLAQAMLKYRRYPQDAMDKGYAGTVQLRLQIDREGQVANVSVIKSSGFAPLDDAARVAAHRAKFLVPIPALLRGHSVEAMVRVAYALSQPDLPKQKPVRDFRESP